MAYGTVKVDNITFDNGGSDQSVTVSGLYRATTSGVTVSGTIAAGTVSGNTVTGTTANFTSGNFSNIISSAATMSGALIMANQQQVQFREAVGNGVNHIALQAPAIVSADQIITLPDETGTIVTTGDNGSVTSTMILDGTITNDDINASAAIAGTKISPNFGSQNIATTGGLQAANFNGGALAGFRNAVINGNFDVWQRGTSFASPGNAVYTADRWEVGFDNTGATRTISRQSFSLGQTDVPGEPTYFLRFDQSVAGSGGNYTQLDQRIEGVRTFAGQQVTISFWAKAAANTTMPGVVFQQLFGSGGSPSSLTGTVAASNVALTTAWQKFSYQASIPSISGKTLGTDNNDALIVVFDLPLNATFTIDIAQVQVELGPVATPFERRIYGQELALCQRYYCVTRANTRGYNPGTSYVETFVYWPQQMRATPTVVNVTNTSSGAQSQTFDDPSVAGCRHSLLGTVAASDCYAINQTITASAEL